MPWKILFSNWGVRWKSSFQKAGKSRGENDTGYLTDFSVNASQSEHDQSFLTMRLTVADLLKGQPEEML